MDAQYSRFSTPTYLDRLRVIIKFTAHPTEEPVEAWLADYAWAGEAEELSLDDIVNDLRGIAVIGDRVASYTLDVHVSETHWGATGLADTILIAVSSAVLSSVGTEAARNTLARIGSRFSRRSVNTSLDPSRITNEGRETILIMFPSAKKDDLVVCEEVYDAEAGTARIVYQLADTGDLYTVDFGVTKRTRTAQRVTRSTRSAP